MTKRINKILWNGTEVPQAATRADGLDGLNLGELFIKNDPQEPGIYTRTTDGKVVLLGGGGSGTSELVDWNSIVNKPTKVSYFINDAGYATTSDLDSRIDALVNGAPQAYDTLKEIADVLAGNVNSISDILTALGNKADKATTLSGYGITDAYTITQIDNIINGLSGNISTLQGYFTDGAANSALKLSDNGSYTAWGQTFFTNGKPKSLSGALTDITDIASSGTITTNKIVIGNGTIEWDEANKGFKVTGLYSTTYLSAKGANTNGGSTPSGNQYTRLDTWDGYTSAMDGWVLSAKLGKGLYDTQNSIISRVGALEGKATNVSFTQSLTSGTQIGSISIDGVTKNIYAPTIPTDDINKGVTAYGWGNHASAGYLLKSGGTIGANSSNPTNLVINSNHAIETAFQVSNNNVVKSVFGWWNGTGSYGTYIYSVASQKYLGIKDDGTPHYHGNTLIHEGNYTDYTYSKSQVDSALGGYLPLSGGTMDGTIILPNNTYIDSQDGSTIFGIDANRGCLVGVSEHPLLLRSNGTSTINGNNLIHSGNIGSQSVASATTAASITINYATSDAKFPLLFTNQHEQWESKSDSIYRDNTSRLGYNPYNDILYANNIQGSGISPYITDKWNDGTNDNYWHGLSIRAVNSIYNTVLSGYYGVTLKTGGGIMTLANSGNVLIGTTTDSGYKLDIVAASGGVLRLKSNDTYSGVQLEQGNGYAWFIGSDNTQELYMYYNGAHRFNLNATGNLKLGGSLWLNHGDYIANRATLVLNSNSNAADIIFKNNSTTKGNFGCWAISSRSESNYRFTIWRGGENATNATEQELFTILANGNFGFANNNPKYRVDVNGVIHSNTGIFSDGYVSAKGQNTSSDMRLKNVLSEVVLGVKDIANAPSIRFAWKKGGGIDVGSSAQYWQGVLPDAVKEMDKHLEMQYGNIALLSAIAIARNMGTMKEDMGTMKQELDNLKKENKELKNRIDMLERGIA